VNEVPVEQTELTNAEGCSGSPGGGRYVILRLSVQEGTILDCSFESNGCPAAHTAVGGLVAFLKGRTLEQAGRLEAGDLLILIGGLPDGKGYYASMAVEALQDALSKFSAPPTSAHDLQNHP
jgi:NifU-like protein involved in Fe-S cluster formation